MNHGRNSTKSVKSSQEEIFEVITKWAFDVLKAHTTGRTSSTSDTGTPCLGRNNDNTLLQSCKVFYSSLVPLKQSVESARAQDRPLARYARAGITAKSESCALASASSPGNEILVDVSYRSPRPGLTFSWKSATAKERIHVETPCMQSRYGKAYL